MAHAGGIAKHSDADMEPRHSLQPHHATEHELAIQHPPREEVVPSPSASSALHSDVSFDARTADAPVLRTGSGEPHPCHASEEPPSPGTASGSAWGRGYLGEAATSVVSLPVTSRRHVVGGGRQRQRQRGRRGLLCAEGSVQEVQEGEEEEEEEDEDGDALSTQRVFDFWGPRAGGGMTAGDSLTHASAAELRMAATSIGDEKGAPALSPSHKSCNSSSAAQFLRRRAEQHDTLAPSSHMAGAAAAVFPEGHGSDEWHPTGLAPSHAVAPLEGVPSGESEAQATVWETMTGHLESMRMKQQQQHHQEEEEDEGGGDRRPCIGKEAGESLQGWRPSRAESPPARLNFEEGDEGLPGSYCRLVTEKPSLGDESDEAVCQLAGGMLGDDDRAYTSGDVGCYNDNEEDDHDNVAGGRAVGSCKVADDATSGGRLSAMTGMSDTALLHLLLQQGQEEQEQRGKGGDSASGEKERGSSVEGEEGPGAVHKDLEQDGVKMEAQVLPGWRGVFDELADVGHIAEAENALRGLLGEQGELGMASEDEEEELGRAEEGIAEGGGGREQAEGSEGKPPQLIASASVEGPMDPGVSGAGEGRVQRALKAAALEVLQAYAGKKGHAELGGYSLTALRPDMARVAQWLTLVEPPDTGEEEHEWHKLPPLPSHGAHHHHHHSHAHAQKLAALSQSQSQSGASASDLVGHGTAAALSADRRAVSHGHLLGTAASAAVAGAEGDAKASTSLAHASSRRPPVSGAIPAGPGHHHHGQALAQAQAHHQQSAAVEVANRFLQAVDKHSPALYLAQHSLQLVPPHLAGFVHLKTLDLSRNGIGCVPSGILPHSLHILDLSHNRLGAVEGLRDLSRLRVLNLSHNRITRIGHGLVGCTAMRELYLTHNKIGEVDGLHRLLKLGVLDLSANKVTSTKAVSQLAANLGSLKALNLLSNPIHVNLGNDAFKRFVTGLLPHLQVLNQRPVKASASSRELIADARGLGGRVGASLSLHHHGHHHSRTASSSALRSSRAAPGAGAGLSSSRRHGSSAALLAPAAAPSRHAKVSGHKGESGGSSRRKEKKSEKERSGRHHHSSASLAVHHQQPLLPPLQPPPLTLNTQRDEPSLQQQQLHLVVDFSHVGQPPAEKAA